MRYVSTKMVCVPSTFRIIIIELVRKEKRNCYHLKRFAYLVGIDSDSCDSLMGRKIVFHLSFGYGIFRFVINLCWKNIVHHFYTLQDKINRILTLWRYNHKNSFKKIVCIRWPLDEFRGTSLILRWLNRWCFL